MEAHVQPVVVLLAIKSGRPVKLILSREEDFETVRARHPFKYYVKTGATKRGVLVAREIEVILDGGAYADDSPGVLSNALRLAAGPYRFKAMRSHGIVVYTNKLRFGAFRGFGQPQIQFGCEQQVDEIANRLGLDPIEMRRPNIKEAGERWFGGQHIKSIGSLECMAKVESASNWKNRTSLPSKVGKRRALGMAISAHVSAVLSSGAIIRMLEDGTIVLNTGATDIGQGSDTVLTQICASALKVSANNVAIASPDTDGSPYNWGTTASRVTYMAGRSVVAAAAEVEERAKRYAGEILECAVEDLELRQGGKIGIKGTEKHITFQGIAKYAHWVKGGPIIGTNSWVFDQKTIDPKRCTTVGNPSGGAGAFSFGALVVDVEVDEATGKVDVLRAWSAVDAGRAINPLSLEGQIQGAFVQGMGFALTEEMVWDGARLANPTLMDYKVPTTRDAPYELYPIIVEANEPDGPFGARGAGEVGINVVAAAIGNAVAAATGVRFNRLPLSPERVLTAMLDGERDGTRTH
jgi:CO/xanthine dehydrogenase Mo-binding subunit